MRAFHHLTAIAVTTALSVVPTPTHADDSARIVLEGATVIDGTGSEPLEDAIVVVDDGLIECVGSDDDCPVPETAHIEELSDRWLMPGLVDAHVHLAQTGFFDGRPDVIDLRDEFAFEQVQAQKPQRIERYFESWLCSGVTSLFDMGGFAWSMQLDEQRQRPDVAATGPLISHAPAELLNLPAARQMLSLEDDDIDDMLGFLDAWGADAAKLWFLAVTAPTRADDVDSLVRRLGAGAADRDLPLAAHATTLREAKVAVEAGATLLVHSVDDAPVDDEFLAMASEADVIYIPTLTVGQGYIDAYRAVTGIESFDIDGPDHCLDAHTAELLDDAERFSDHPSTAHLTPRRLRAIERHRQQRMAQAALNLDQVHEAGITIAAGSDAGNPGTPHGPSIHTELRAMQDAGLSPEDIIPMATKHGARAMGRSDDFGTIDKGMRADILVLSADPIDDISHLAEIDAVMRAGQFVEPR